MIVDVLAWILLLLGSFFLVVGGIGLHRMPDFFARMHASSVIDTLGAGLILLGLCLPAGFSLVTFKLILIWGFLLLSSATTGHALTHAALVHGLRPILRESAGKEDEPSSSK